jgi:hypothetical protein
MFEVGKCHIKKQIRGLRGRGKQISLSLLLIISAIFAEDRREPIVQAYELYDARFCNLTPMPFLCEGCLLQGRRFARFLSFDLEGRPYREYGCIDYIRPYLR